MLAVEGQDRAGHPLQGRPGQGLHRLEVGEHGRVVDEGLGIAGQLVELAAALLDEPLVDLVLGQSEGGEGQAAGHVVAPALDREVGLDEGDACHPVGVLDRHAQGDHAAVAVADEVDRVVDAEGVEQADEVGDRVVHRVARGRTLAAAVAPQVVEDDVALAGEGVGQRVVPARQVVHDEAVQHDHGVLARAEPGHVEPHPVGDDVSHGAPPRGRRRCPAGGRASARRCARRSRARRAPRRRRRRGQPWGTGS